MTTGIDLVLADHRQVEELFRQFESTRDPSLVGRIVAMLTDHDQAEHAALYPLARVVLADEALLERSMIAHSAVTTAIDQLRQLEGQPLLDAVEALQALVAAHVADEETALLPALVERATAAQLEGLGARIEQAKQRVG